MSTKAITPADIAAWKEKWGEVYKISVAGRECYLRRPSRKALGYASVAGKDNPLKFSEVILADCWLGGDDEIKTDDALFLAAAGTVGELIKVEEAHLEKL